jgi:hypothetical protein
MTFEELLDQAIAMLQRRGRVTYGALKPFFLEESVRMLVETGVLVGQPGAYHLAKPLDNLQVPATVHAVLEARIDRRPPEEKRLLQTAAVRGMGEGPGVLSAGGGKGHGAVSLPRGRGVLRAG